MIRHKRLRPPSDDYPADEWNVIEKGFRPEFLAQVESIMALGNGYLGMRGCPEEGGPNVENSTLINGFYETHPIVYGEDAFGFDSDAVGGESVFAGTGEEGAGVGEEFGGDADPGARLSFGGPPISSSGLGSLCAFLAASDFSLSAAICPAVTHFPSANQLAFDWAAPPTVNSP